MNNENKTQCRTISIKGDTYIRKEDVAAFLRDIAATEETDTRNRLEQAAKNVEKLK